MKRKLCYLLLVFVLLISCIGCGKNDSQGKTNESENKITNIETESDTEIDVIVANTEIRENSEKETETINSPELENESSEIVSKKENTTEKKKECNHNYTDATCTESEQCKNCGKTKGSALGHADDGKGYCIRCNKQLYKITLSSSSYNVDLEESTKSCKITVTGTNDFTVYFAVENTNVVTCQWSDKWDNGTTELYFKPIATGSTIVRVYIEGVAEIKINVSVYKPTAADKSSLTMNGIGEEHELWYSAQSRNTSIIESADYTISSRNNGNIDINIDVLAKMIHCSGSATDYIGIDYELFDERGVCVKNGLVWIRISHLEQLYEYNISLYNLEPGNYRLEFSGHNM